MLLCIVSLDQDLLYERFRATIHGALLFVFHIAVGTSYVFFRGLGVRKCILGTHRAVIIHDRLSVDAFKVLLDRTRTRNA